MESIKMESKGLKEGKGERGSKTETDRQTCKNGMKERQDNRRQ